MSVCVDQFLSNQYSTFRKGYGTQHCLSNLVEKFKNSVNKGKYVGALLTDLSNALSCLDHELLTAKLNTYGYSLSALQLIYDYLSNIKQRAKIHDNYSFWLEILFSVNSWSTSFLYFLDGSLFCGKRYRYFTLCIYCPLYSG